MTHTSFTVFNYLTCTEYDYCKALCRISTAVIYIGF